ncbi:toxin-antitoxin system protein [Nonlabens antarcticus]|uniref:toxin-antitoxin system protein n=1 Tax=Nonlabens antarcticus TaxID=392714 RepID=UPI001891B198|nr:toxin-antitoxin system protein [Nonlabens antarcticus]
MSKQEKVQVELTFTLDQELFERFRKKAKDQNLSQNDYLEILIRRDIWNIPNDETIAAIEEAHSGKELEEITDLDEFLASL